jgi:hypothetical protein
VQWFAEKATRADGVVIPSPAQGKRLFALREPVGQSLIAGGVVLRARFVHA